MRRHHFSSDQFAASRFPLHGRTEVLVHGRILRTVAWGPFNLELVNAQLRVLAEAARWLPPDRQYLELVEYRDSLLMPGEGWEKVSGFLDKTVAQGYCAKTTVIVGGPEVEGYELFGDRFRKLWSRSRPVESVATRAEGEARIQALLESFGLDDAQHQDAPDHRLLSSSP